MRTGQTTPSLMRNLDIADTRDKLRVYTEAGILGPGATPALPELGKGTKGD